MGGQALLIVFFWHGLHGFYFVFPQPAECGTTTEERGVHMSGITEAEIAIGGV